MLEVGGMPVRAVRALQLRIDHRNRPRALILVVAAATVFMCVGCSSSEPASGPSASPASKSTTGAVRPVPHLPLPAGTYSSEVFATPLTYTVPDGWKMFEDEPGQFGLALVANDHPCVCVWRDISVAAKSCAEAPEPGVGRSAKEITTWLASREGLATTEPKAVTVGGLSGYLIDIKMDPAWTGTCPFSGGTYTVPMFVGSGISAGVFWGSDADSSQREYVLDLGPKAADGNIVINVQICCGVAEGERIAAVTPVIDSFVFKT
jgi:hypothetical protein